MARPTCNRCPHMRCRGESIVRRDGISELAHALEAGGRDTQPVLRLYCCHAVSIAAAEAAGTDVRHELIVEPVDGVDHVCGSTGTARIAEYRDAVSLDEIGEVPSPPWCGLPG
ncbi:MAG: hypothetical protein FDZ70_02140 [Actinobacteria bacterium]|nr:MAG: hypothetical protein FDZ70_02140 [Actinomycetota bacterium]